LATTTHSDPHPHAEVGPRAAHGEGHGEEHGHGHGHGDEHGHGHGHGMSHVLPLKVLLGTWGSLVVLTIVTVAVARLHTFDFGANINLAIAMLIATVKATLVCLFFMHLRYDKKFHSIVFVSAILLATLFVSFTLMDSTQYQTDVSWVHDDLSPSPY
jgi:caa(3)-type oxidase subunit IV